jgi:hypothetical protein
LIPDKSVVILCGIRQRASGYSDISSVDVAGVTISLSNHTEILGATRRSSRANFLTDSSHKLDFVARAFRFAGPTVFNSVPSDIYDVSTFNDFCSRLKTHY